MAASSYNKMGTAKFDKVCCLIYKAGVANATGSCRVYVANSRYDLRFFRKLFNLPCKCKVSLKFRTVLLD